MSILKSILCKTIELFLLLAFCSSAYANDFEERVPYIRKLGKVLHCPENKNAHLQLLDLFEAKNQYSFEVSIPDTGNPVIAAARIIEKLNGFHQNRYEYYKAILTQVIPQQTRFLKTIELGGVPAESALLPAECTQKTVMTIRFINGSSEDDFDIEVLIDQNLYRKLNFENQTTLWIHIILGFEGIGYNLIENPIGTRMYTGLLVSNNFQKLNKKQFSDFLYSIDFYNWLDTFLPPPAAF